MLKSIHRYLTTRSVRKSTENELNRLSDRELNDLGISRFDIASIARETAGMARV